MTTHSSPGNGNGNGATARWQLMISATAVMLAVAGGFLTLLMNINTLSNNLSSLTIRVNALETAVSTAQERLVEVRTDIASTQRDLVEIETQFCAEDAMRNLMHANDLRVDGVMWAKIIGGDLPVGNAYYPSVGRCEGREH